ncbi:protein related to ser/arg-related nuclear matrix protein [Hirsutella rhossiliensis]|uniref:Proteinrelated to ser/arg-related nuclear matrix protein n=1 Tax=Hirsutella rhossiliensis TaxID=111463 RepID=A0A9P8SLD5_9HYPO|nr:proteinrelated to ser/arg-related nuclear matrix protein [Hirsutella rhossiliensis]KAH0965046.1 proteinrelated to ser/arg-related nuclear matrix protein [Hirsutella rhossiliensis]
MRTPTSPAVTPKKTSDSWQIPAFDPEKHRLSTDRPVGSYRRYSETKEQNGSGGLPECPRTVPVMGKMDWLTLPRTNFNICPTCYDSVFAKSEFRTHFQPILRPTDEAIVCDFGSSPWYRIAWLLTVKHERQDLRLFYHVVNVTASSRGEACPGSQRSTRNWLTIKDPYTRRPVSEFAVCYRCAMIVEALLPNLTGLFVPLSSRSEPLKKVCALHFTPKRKQFVRYFDALETTSDKALVGSQAPDIADLAQELRRLSVGHECREDNPVRDGYWHMMQSLPEMTVCDACFNEVVRPRVQDGNSVAQGFFTKPQRLPVATCQLYSPRMREIFHKACRRRDREYLEARVLERREIEADIFEKLLKLDKAQRNDARSEKQVERLVEEWKRWE